MPYIVVKSPEGAIPPEKRKALAAAITKVASDVEQIGEDPRQQALTWVFFEGFQVSAVFAGGHSPLLIPVVVLVSTPEGVVEAEGKAQFMSGIDRAIREALGPTAKRMVATSVIVSPVPDGDWGTNGQRWKLADFARAAGYRHLRHLVTA